MKVENKDIKIRSFLREDIPLAINYWTKNSEEFWRVRGVDKLKMPSESRFIEIYENAFRLYDDVESTAIILYKNKPVGVHTLTSIIANESAVFHAHIWDEENRRKGIAFYSCIKASEFFLKKLNLQKIIFMPPKMNAGSSKVMEKLGFTYLGETLFDDPILIKPLEANKYEVNLDLLEKIKSKLA